LDNNQILSQILKALKKKRGWRRGGYINNSKVGCGIGEND
jgi:hypothetical protein